jgi:phosphoserine phosphatase
MPNITWCDLPEDVSLWPGLPLSLSGDEVMPLDYHAGRSGWLLYGRGLDKQRLTQYQSKLGAAMVIVAAWCVEDYQVIRLAGSLTPRAPAWRMTPGWTLRRWVKFRICARRVCW